MISAHDIIVRAKVRKLYREIDEAEDKLLAIRKQCPHNHIEVGDYEVRAGLILNESKICSICGEFLGNEQLTFTIASVN